MNRTALISRENPDNLFLRIVPIPELGFSPSRIRVFLSERYQKNGYGLAAGYAGGVFLIDWLCLTTLPMRVDAVQHGAHQGGVDLNLRRPGDLIPASDQGLSFFRFQPEFSGGSHEQSSAMDRT